MPGRAWPAGRPGGRGAFLAVRFRTLAGLDEVSDSSSTAASTARCVTPNAAPSLFALVPQTRTMTRLMTRLVSVGILPEHVHTPAHAAVPSSER